MSREALYNWYKRCILGNRRMSVVKVKTQYLKVETLRNLLKMCLFQEHLLSCQTHTYLHLCTCARLHLYPINQGFLLHSSLNVVPLDKKCLLNVNLHFCSNSE